MPELRTAQAMGVRHAMPAYTGIAARQTTSHTTLGSTLSASTIWGCRSREALPDPTAGFSTAQRRPCASGSAKI